MPGPFWISIFKKENAAVIVVKMIKKKDFDLEGDN